MNPRLQFFLPERAPGRVRWMVIVIFIAAGLIAAGLWLETPVQRRALALAVICLALWLGEAVRPWVPAVILFALAPVWLGWVSPQFSARAVAGWLAEPVLALFFGGFALSVGASRHGLDEAVARLAVHGAGGRPGRLLVLAAGVTAALSMWMSNVAAAAMMFGALRPVLAPLPEAAPLRRALLLAVALGANFGGMGTPIGSGPNGLAIAALEATRPITFLDWMVFALPLTVALLAAGVALLWRTLPRAGAAHIAVPAARTLSGRARALLALFAATIALWLTEPWHGWPSWLVALGAVGVLLLTRLLRLRDLGRVDWSTLLLIAGGIALGRVLEKSGLVRLAAGAVPWYAAPEWARLLALCGASALLAAVMSNTGTAAMLIPLAASLDPAPTTPVLIAIATSLGMPFVISTPANAMAFGEGGLRTRDLLVPGLILMIGGVLLVSFTGPTVLHWAGVK